MCGDFLPREGTVASGRHPEGTAACAEFGESLRKQRHICLIIFKSIIRKHTYEKWNSAKNIGVGLTSCLEIFNAGRRRSLYH